MKNRLFKIALAAIFAMGISTASFSEPNCSFCKVTNYFGGESNYMSTVNGACYKEDKLCFFTTQCNMGYSTCIYYYTCNSAAGCRFEPINP